MHHPNDIIRDRIVVRLFLAFRQTARDFPGRPLGLMPKLHWLDLLRVSCETCRTTNDYDKTKRWNLSIRSDVTIVNTKFEFWTRYVTAINLKSVFLSGTGFTSLHCNNFSTLLSYNSGDNSVQRVKNWPRSMIDVRPTDRVTVPTRVGLRCCPWPRPHHARRTPRRASQQLITWQWNCIVMRTQ